MKGSLAKARAKLLVSKKDAIPSSVMVEAKYSRPGKRSRKVKIPINLISESKKNIISHTKYVLDTDIKGCFDNISHNWLIEHVPISPSYKTLLYKILKTNIVEAKPEDYKIGILRPFFKATWLE